MFSNTLDKLCVATWPCADSAPFSTAGFALANMSWLFTCEIVVEVRAKRDIVTFFPRRLCPLVSLSLRLFLRRAIAQRIHVNTPYCIGQCLADFLREVTFEGCCVGQICFAQWTCGSGCKSCVRVVAVQAFFGWLFTYARCTVASWTIPDSRLFL